MKKTIQEKAIALGNAINVDDWVKENYYINMACDVQESGPVFYMFGKEKDAKEFLKVHKEDS